MLHRFLASVSVWVGGVAACRRGMPRSFSLLGFNFGVNFRFSGAFHWHFICSRMKEQEGESERGRVLLVVPCVSLCVPPEATGYDDCLSVCPSSQVPVLPFPSIPSACVLRFLVRFVFVSPSQFC